jgi:hypothetical protein
LKSYLVTSTSLEILEQDPLGTLPFLNLMHILVENLRVHFDKNIFTIMYTTLVVKTEGMK